MNEYKELIEKLFQKAAKNNITDMEAYGYLDKEILEDRLSNRPDEISKANYNEDTEGGVQDQETWESDRVEVSGFESVPNYIDYSDSGMGVRVTDNFQETWVGERYDEDVYVDDVDGEFDYQESREDWINNYYGGEYDSELITKVRDNEIMIEDEIIEIVEQTDPERADELRAVMDDGEWVSEAATDAEIEAVIKSNYIDNAEINEALLEWAEDEGLLRDTYSAKVSYQDFWGNEYDEVDDAVKYTISQMYEDYKSEAGENLEIYKDYTIDGGHDYNLETYQMPNFDEGRKNQAREPHFGDLGEDADLNVQVHTRFKNRYDADDLEGRVLEEIQSQWEQDWRKQGGGQRVPSQEEREAAYDLYNEKVDQTLAKQNELEAMNRDIVDLRQELNPKKWRQISKIRPDICAA